MTDTASKMTLDQLKRLDMRRRPARDSLEEIEEVVLGINDLWSNYQDQCCRRGKPMVSDRRGLPPGYATGPTWQRAAAERAAHPSKSTC